MQKYQTWASNSYQRGLNSIHDTSAIAFRVVAANIDAIPGEQP